MTGSAPDGLRAENFDEVETSEDQDQICRTTDYAPHVFHAIRKLYDIDTQYYKSQLMSGLSAVRIYNPILEICTLTQH